MKAELPKSWKSLPLGDVCKTLKGKKPKNSGKISKDRTIPYINIKAFETGIPAEYAAPGDYPECSKTDVLIVWDGARSGLTGRGVSGYIGSTLSKIWSDIIDSGYLYYFLQSQYDYINTNTKGVGIPHVDPNILYSINFPVAPENEQNLIVAEIEKQFSRLDEAVDNLKRVKANLKRYKASVLKAAVEGKLTEEWREANPDVESADKLLERILVERRKKWEETELAKMKARGKEPKDDKWKKKYKGPEKPKVENLPDIPATWLWARLDSVTEIKGGITKDSKRKIKNAKELPYLRVANVQRGYLDLDKIKYIKVPEDKLPELLLKNGDILFNEGGDRDKLGRGWVWEGQIQECTYQNHVFRARLFLNEVAGKFFSWYGNTFGQQYFMAKGKQTTNLASINKTMLSAFPIPLPPVDEQVILINKIEERLSMINAVEKEVDINLMRADRLRQSILKKAFSGELIHSKGP
ncbi:MAG: restriction endonuclease subunit S [Desulfobacteraceae bacterium]|nr:restriction endonuclease subunit S [Desulfobacteraceae bacterium]